MKVAIIGATGYVGGRLVPELLKAGHEVRCLARTPNRLDGVPWRADVDVAQADALDPDSLKQGLADMDVAYYLVHAMGHADDFEEVDRRAATNVAQAAAANDLSRIVYLGGLGAEGELSAHLASRHEVGRALATGPVPVTELRAAVIIGSGSASFEMLRSLVEVLPAMVCPRWVTSTQCQPIAIEDVLFYLVEVVEHPETAGEILEIGGPDVLTYRDMMDRYAVISGLKPRIIIPVPVLTPSLSSHWVNLVTALPIGLARPLVDSLVVDVVVRPEHDVRRYIDHDLISFDRSIEDAIRRVKDLDVRTSWTDSAITSAAEPMPQDPDWAGGTLYEDVQEVVSSAPPHEVFRVVAGIGGKRGWYVTPFLWHLRGTVDELIGGVGMRRGRRHPDELRVGDALDFFRVEDYEPDRLLRLRAEMKVPGGAWLEWTTEPTGDGGTRLRQLARFHPQGITGRVYWFALLPFHTVIFRQLAERIAREAEQAPADAATPAAAA